MAAQQYDPNDQYAGGYDPYAAQYAEGDAYATQSESEPYAGQYASGYDLNDQFASEYAQFAEPEAPFEPPYDDPGLYPEPSATPPTRGSQDPEYYVSLEPCTRSSSSMYAPVNPKCTIRLVGKGYQKDIELSLDSKMDSLIYRIFRSLEDEGICLDGVRLQGLPKRSCFKDCLAAICAPFTALCSTKPICCQTLPRPCCCSSIVCQEGSFDLSPRRSTASARFSLGRRRAPVCSTHSRKPRIRRHKPCRMAKICQGPKKDDCVLIKISPSLPKFDGVKCEKRSTGVGTDDFPELEILLQSGNKKRCAAKKKGKCVCPHCCSGGKIKLIKCRSRVPKRQEPREEEPIKWPKEEGWSEAPPTKPLDEMSEGELDSLLGRLERDENRFSFSNPPPRSSVNFVLVESGTNSFEKSDFLGSGSRLLLTKKVDVCTNPSEERETHDSADCTTPLKVYSLHHRSRNDQSSNLRLERTISFKNKTKKSDSGIAGLLEEVLHLANEILKNQKQKQTPEGASSSQVEKPREPPQKSLVDNKLNPIFCRSDLWISGSDVASTIGLPVTAARLRNFPSSKSTNFVARLKKRHRRKNSPKKSVRFQPIQVNQEVRSDKFEKLKIYLETDRKDKSAEFVPIELTKKDRSVHLDTLIR